MIKLLAILSILIIITAASCGSLNNSSGDSGISVTTIDGISMQVTHQWSGTTNKVFDFSTDKSPVVLVFGYQSTSQIMTSFGLQYQGGNQMPVGGVFWTPFYPAYNVTNHYTLDGSGPFRVQVTCTGCSWWINACVESGVTLTNSQPTFAHAVTTPKFG